MSLATRNEVWDALPPVRFGEDRPLDLDLDATTERQLVTRLFSRDFDDWSQVLSRGGSAPTRSGWSAARRPSTPPPGKWSAPTARRTRPWA